MSLGKKLLLLGVLSYVILSANIGGYSIYILDEAKNTQCAREMADRGDWVVPTFNQLLRTDKPPLHYFFMRASYAVFGDDAYGARFFSAVFGTLTVLITFLFARTYLSERAGIFAVLTLLTSLGFVTQFHLAVPDPYLIFFIASALFSYFHYEQQSNRRYLYLAYVAVALGVLTKGPIAIVLPGMGIFFYMIYKKKLTARELLLLNPPLGILIILLIAGPWYYLVHQATDGAWTKGFFLDHNVNRFNSPREGHSGGFWLPTAYAIGMLLPFSIFIIQAIRLALKEKKDLLIYSLITLGCMLFFFSVASTKLPGYTSPIFPFAAIILGNYLSKIETLKVKWVWASIFFFAIVAFGLFFGSKLGIAGAKEIRHLTHLQWYFLPLPIAALSAIVLLYLRKIQPAVVTAGIGFLIMHQLFFYYTFPEINRQNPVIKTTHLLEGEANLVAFHRLNAGYVHALDRQIPLLYEEADILEYLNGKQNAILFTRPEYLELLPNITYTEIAREPDLFDGTTTVILKVLP